MMTAEEKELRERISRLGSLVQETETFSQPAEREKAQQIVRTLLEIHGIGLKRILDHIVQAGDAGRTIIDAIAQDDLLGDLLLLYELHPLSLETRISQALESVRPYLRSHGGDIELLGINEGVIRLRMQGSCHGCPSSAMTLKLAVEEAIYAKAPDIAGIAVEGVVETAGPADSQRPSKTTEAGFVPVEQVLRNGRPRAHQVVGDH